MDLYRPTDQDLKYQEEWELEALERRRTDVMRLIEDDHRVFTQLLRDDARDFRVEQVIVAVYDKVRVRYLLKQRHKTTYFRRTKKLNRKEIVTACPAFFSLQVTNITENDTTTTWE